ncbi:hypothetical protein MLD38_003313 [Melastoma candidum]|uniref:Uncharacterized protein n=1 Tax=Melastoma candidum TaxID=119954 RepID=A0ACB9S5C5_9MYRT|nr:hypothetical protein MLD38_003313 [Melastoma candidum]
MHRIQARRDYSVISLLLSAATRAERGAPRLSAIPILAGTARRLGAYLDDEIRMQPMVPANWYPPLPPPNPPPSHAFWETRNVHAWLTNLKETLLLAKAMERELRALKSVKEAKESGHDLKDGSLNDDEFQLVKQLEQNVVDIDCQEFHSVRSANALVLKLKGLLEPFRVITDETSPWEEKYAAFKLSNRIKKSRRNKIWRKKKRKRVAELLVKEHESFDEVNQHADEWRAREIAKDSAKAKVEKMNDIAKLKAKEERKKLESELEMVLIVEKLRELRSLRIQKMKKQGHFLPTEDDEFLERVRAAVEEEERQTLTTADADTAKEVIPMADETQTVDQMGKSVPENLNSQESRRAADSADSKGKWDISKSTVEFSKEAPEGNDQVGAYDSMANLPMEFYHYYHGSSTDMGTLIEVRRGWDAYIRPGGSRIPGHWVQPPPPADDVWASYLVKP